MAALFGLFAAGSAENPGDLYAGLAAFGLAIVALARGIKSYFDGASTVLWAPVLVEDTASLLLLLFLLAALAILGLMLASRTSNSVWHDVGYALFATCLAMIAFNLKHYFDARERSRQDSHSTQDRG